jgi:predicted MPP superfamily phosphohydrolase
VNTIARLTIGAVAAGIGGLGYAAGIERRRWTLRRATLPVLDEGARPLRVLHISDVHMTPGQHAKQRWIADLDELEPDLVVNTGDNLAHVLAATTTTRQGPRIPRATCSPATSASTASRCPGATCAPP